MNWQGLRARFVSVTLTSVVLGLSQLTSVASAVSPQTWLEKAPPPFGYRDGSVVPVDIESVDITYTFDVATSRTTAHAVVTFNAELPGYPLLDLVPEPTAVKFNEAVLTPADLPVVAAPGGTTNFRVLRQTVAAGSRHVLEIDYALGSDVVTYASGYVRAGFFTDDLTSTGRGFFEQYGPANYEFDQVHYSFHVRVTGTQTAHTIFTNGALTATGTNTWDIDFPEYFTTSSIYFHISEGTRFSVQNYTYQGTESSFPVTVYSSSSSTTASAVSSSRRILAELEATFGAYAHDRLVIYVAGSGGMEYCGATMTDLSALGHELTHSWFARGVMPSNGNSGWIDEAVASWRDNDYPRANGRPNRAAVNLGGFSPYRRHTTTAAYTQGAQLISEFDAMFASQGGMRSVLKDLFAAQKRQTITLQYFKTFLEQTTANDLTAIFNRYVLGQSQLDSAAFDASQPVTTDAEMAKLFSKHPRRYTKAELARYR